QGRNTGDREHTGSCSTACRLIMLLDCRTPHLTLALLMVISPGWPTMRSGSSNRRQHAPKPSDYDISTLPRSDITTLLSQICHTRIQMSTFQLFKNVRF
ncbi:hypothetical protein, partial [Burkholderia ambifaria]|uniref:hypothetical protein n=1 Tax=Burkholderia ambifaria TaxID=152480 RepID=UPI001ABA14ED